MPLQSVDVWFDCTRSAAYAIRASSRGMQLGRFAAPVAAKLDKPFFPDAHDPWNIRVEVGSDTLLGAIEAHCPCRYRTTAEITAWCLGEVLDQGLVSGEGGVLPPSSVVSAGRFFEAFSEQLRLGRG
ncbi:MAG: hypothetical protein GY884_12920 [Proteobacteria bacterium]|nr:hypothetical protein [Pseudomonadota bacterium]